MQRQLIGDMKPGIEAYRHNQQAALRRLFDLPERIWQAQRQAIERLLLWSHTHAASAMIKVLPRAYLRTATATKLQESRQPIRVMEHGGPVQFSVQQTVAGPQFLTHDPFLSPGREEDLWRQFLFPPPDADLIKTILDRLLPPRHVQGALFDELGTAASPQTPQTLAAKIAQSFSLGKSTAEVGREVRPYFEGSSVRAERSVRTLGAYVGTERNLATSQALGDLVVGWQVHDAGGENARPEHVLRSGTVYYKDPKPGQYGTDVMPHPPQDTGKGPHDDRAGINYNCRCWLSVVLRHMAAMDTTAFTDNADRLLPDVSHFADWFATASTPQRHKAAGVRRLALAADLLQRTPTWADIVNPDTGRLLTLDQLKGENEQDREQRRAKVQATISVNRALVKRVAAFGSV